jgi:hypothetical protein
VGAVIKDGGQLLASLALQGLSSVENLAAQGEQAVEDLPSSADLQLYLTTGLAPASQNAQSQNSLMHPMDGVAGGSSSNTPAMAWLPLQIPTNAMDMAFDFIVVGDPVDDALVCAMGQTNLFTLQAKYIPTNTVSASRLIDISAWAGTTNELFFGFLGGTSTNATLQIDNIRFYSLQPPSLQAQLSGNSVVVTWPISAQNFSLQTTTNLADPNSWVTLTNVPTIVDFQNAITNPISGSQGFYRLVQFPQ